MHHSQGDAADRFRAVFEAHYGAVLASARRRAGAEDAQDAVAETFAVAWRRLDDVPPADVARPWLYGVARRVLANQRRGNVRRSQLAARLTSRSKTAAQPVDPFDSEAGRDAVLAALARLKESDRELLRLVAWEELSHRDIAYVLGCSEGSVAVRLHRARSRLAKEMAKGGGGAGQVRRRDPTALDRRIAEEGGTGDGA